MKDELIVIKIILGVSLILVLSLLIYCIYIECNNANIIDSFCEDQGYIDSESYGDKDNFRCINYNLDGTRYTKEYSLKAVKMMKVE